MRKTKIKKSGIVNSKTLIVAIDIGKTNHYGYLRSPDGKDMKPFSFPNSHNGFNTLWERILCFKIEQNLEKIVVGFESTGPYAEPLAHFLAKKPVNLVQVNPMHTKRLKELMDNSPNKTDKKDPKVIADIISLGHFLTLVIPEGPVAELRRLFQARERAIKSRTSTVNQLHHLLFVVFPEFTQIIKNIKTKTALYLLKNYPTPESIVSLSLDELTITLNRISHGKHQQKKAKQLLEIAHNSIGISEGKQSILLEIQHLVETIENINIFVAQLTKQMSLFLHLIPYSQSVLSIKGIGEITLAGLIGEVGDFRKFRTISEIMKLAGLDLYEVSSGKHKGQRHISKRGRRLMRKLLFLTALKLVRSDGIMHQRYQEMIDRGMPKVKALIAISRKLLRLIFALARDNSVYVENHSNVNYLKLAA